MNRWNAVNSLFKRAFKAATVQVLRLWDSFITDRRLLSKPLIHFKFKILVHHCHNLQDTIIQAVFDQLFDLCVDMECEWLKASQ